MNVDGKHYRTIWPGADGRSVEVIDQARLPHEFATSRIASCEGAATAIRDMVVRGAPLIGVTAAYGLALAIRDDESDAALEAARAQLLAARPTAVNLRWALDRVQAALGAGDRFRTAWRLCAEICDEDVLINRAIGEHGLAMLERILAERGGPGPLNVMTHCNAGWLATVDWGTALAPIYMAHEAGIPVHVWICETRPRDQGASLTAWELGHHGVPHTLIVDSAAGHLMQRGLVDCVITGTDRTAANGDVCNKIGTYLKALAARDCGVPFYVGLPGPTIDWTAAGGHDIPIEARDAREVTDVTGRSADGKRTTVTIAPRGTAAANPAFDVTPAHMVTGLITERGIAPASRSGLAALYPEKEDAPVAIQKSP